MKPGVQTSEFKLIAGTIAGILVSMGLISVSDAEMLIKFLDATVAFTTVAILAVAYLQKRTELKKEVPTVLPTTTQP